MPIVQAQPGQLSLQEKTRISDTVSTLVGLTLRDRQIATALKEALGTRPPSHFRVAVLGEDSQYALIPTSKTPRELRVAIQQSALNGMMKVLHSKPLSQAEDVEETHFSQLHEIFFPHYQESGVELFTSGQKQTLQDTGKWDLVGAHLGTVDGKPYTQVFSDVAGSGGFFVGRKWAHMMISEDDFTELHTLLSERDALATRVGHAEKSVSASLQNPEPELEAAKQAFEEKQAELEANFGPVAKEASIKTDGSIQFGNTATLFCNSVLSSFLEPYPKEQAGLLGADGVTVETGPVLVHTKDSLKYHAANGIALTAELDKREGVTDQTMAEARKKETYKGVDPETGDVERSALFGLIKKMAVIEEGVQLSNPNSHHGFRGIGNYGQGAADGDTITFDPESKEVRHTTILRGRPGALDAEALVNVMDDGGVVSVAHTLKAQRERVSINAAGGLDNGTQTAGKAREEFQEEVTKPVFILSEAEVSTLIDEVAAVEGLGLSKEQVAVVIQGVAQRFANPEEIFESASGDGKTVYDKAKDTILKLYQDKFDAHVEAIKEKDPDGSVNLALHDMTTPFPIKVGLLGADEEPTGLTLNLLDPRLGSGIGMLNTMGVKVAPSNTVKGYSLIQGGTKTLESKCTAQRTLSEMLDHALTIDPKTQRLNGLWSGHIYMFVMATLTAVLDKELPASAIGPDSEVRRVAHFLGMDTDCFDDIESLGISDEAYSKLDAQRCADLAKSLES